MAPAGSAGAPAEPGQASPGASRDLFRFAEFEIDPANCLLRREGAIVKLGPQPFKVLALLVSRAGDLVTRDELRRAIWDDQTNVDYEHGLNTCIRQIRHALGRNVGAELIETVPKLGYRFKTPVERVARPGVRPGRVIRGVPSVLAVALLTVVTMTAVAAVYSSRSKTESVLRPPLSRGDTRWPTPSPQAYELYMRGREAVERGGQAAQLGLQLLEQSVALDPGFAHAHAAIAAVLLRRTASTGIQARQAYERAKDAAERALSLAPSLPEAHLAAAQVKSSVRDWVGAEREFMRAIALAPDSSPARAEYATWLALQGRLTEAIAQADRALVLDRLSRRAHYTAGLVRRFARRCEEAGPYLNKALELDPQYGPAHHEVGQCHQMAGRHDLAIESYRRGAQAAGNLGHALAMSGRTGEARTLLAQLIEQHRQTGVGAGLIAQICVGLGEYESALDWLEKGLDAPGGPPTWKVAAVWDPLRSSPRFSELLHKAGLDSSSPSR